MRPGAARPSRWRSARPTRNGFGRAGARGLRHDRDLERAHDRLRATGRSASARSAIRCRTARCASSRSTAKGAAGATAPPDEIGVVAMHGPGVFSGYLSDGAQPRRLRRAGLGQLRRPRPPRRGRLPVDHRAGQGPDHPRRPQHRPDGDRGGALPASGGRAGRRRRRARCLRRRAAGGLRAAQARREGRRRPSCSRSSRERTPERAAVPVQLYFIDAMPLTAVGKVFKPALRWDAARARGATAARRRAAGTRPSRSRSAHIRSTAP